MQYQHEPTKTSYDRISIALHWITGGGILALAVLELVRHEFPRDHFVRLGLKPIHQPLGVLLLVLVIARVAWALLGQRKPDSATENEITAKVVRIVHGMLYALMVAIPVVGIASVFTAGKPLSLGWLELVPPSGLVFRELAKPLREIHETLALSLLGLVGLHAAAALFHHYVLRDGVLRSMLVPSWRLDDQAKSQTTS
ncbi:MAG: cytochrome b [Hyphomicrobiaceae bacterium]